MNRHIRWNGSIHAFTLTVRSRCTAVQSGHCGFGLALIRGCGPPAGQHELRRSYVYLLGGLPLGAAAFVAAIAGFAAGAGTLVVWAGLPILAGPLRAARGFAELERRATRQATWLDLPPHHYRRARGSGIRRWSSALADPQSSRDLPGDQRLAGDVEYTAYFVVTEALTNVAKHSGATSCTITVGADDRQVLVQVTDDGRGGAQLGKGHGLSGLADRLATVEGVLDVASPRGGSTVLTAEIPLIGVRG